MILQAINDSGLQTMPVYIESVVGGVLGLMVNFVPLLLTLMVVMIVIWGLNSVLGALGGGFIAGGPPEQVAAQILPSKPAAVVRRVWVQDTANFYRCPWCSSVDQRWDKLPPAGICPHCGAPLQIRPENMVSLPLPSGHYQTIAEAS